MKKYLFIVSCNYFNSLYVPLCESDGEKFSEIVCKNTKIKESIMIRGKYATKNNILNKLDSFISKINKGFGKKMLIIAFFGHGVQVDDINGDEIDKKDEGYVCYDEKIIIDDEIKERNEKLKKTKIFLYADCCHSGTFLDSCTKGNWISLTSCGDSELAYQYHEGSYMTFHFLNIINQNKNISYKDMFQKLKEQMEKGILKDMQKAQLHHIKNSNINTKVFY
jgi:hypothetical protein